MAFFEQAEVIMGPIYDIAQLLADPHIIAREPVAEYPNADMGAYPMHHVVPRLDAAQGTTHTPAPRLRQHNRELLAEPGVDATACAGLLAAVSVFESGA